MVGWHHQLNGPEFDKLQEIVKDILKVSESKSTDATSSFNFNRLTYYI